jgi:hypothetical protein
MGAGPKRRELEEIAEGSFDSPRFQADFDLTLRQYFYTGGWGHEQAIFRRQP